MMIIFRWLKRANARLIRHADNVGCPYKLFGIFSVIAYPLFYFIWLYSDPMGYESLTARLVATVLSIPLIFEKVWPAKYRDYLPLYWYFTLLYCLPFFFTFMLLKNSVSYAWALNTLTGIVLSILLLDMLALFITFPIGIALGIIFYKFTTSGSVAVVYSDYKVLIVTYGAVIVFGSLFARRREQTHQEKLKTIQMVAASMAHELRTPLRAISAAVSGLSRYLPSIIAGYEKAQKHHPDIPFIPPSDRKAIERSLTNVECETQAAFTAVDMLLIKSDMASIDFGSVTPCSIVHCVDEALRRYAFDIENPDVIRWRPTSDFLFHGNELLLIHVIFNLLKNALYYIRAGRQGHIDIRLEAGKPYNYLYFRDTGKGIPASILPHIFDRFFTKTPHGAGVGLSFCKMVMQGFRGDIVCHSKEGAYTEFVLSFPNISIN